MEITDAPAISVERENFVECKDGQGQDIQATLLRFTRYQIAFDIYTPGVVIQMSQVLSPFKVHVEGKTIYSGRAVITGIVTAGPSLTCEATLDDSGLDFRALVPSENVPLTSEFVKFLHRWQKTYRVLPEFKVVVADMQSLFADLRLWLDEVDLGIRSSGGGNGATTTEKEIAAAAEIAKPVLAAIDSLGDKFEEITASLEPAERGAHIHFSRRHLHALLLCSPFAHRTYHKPLGYAGDYQMVNMILENPYQGDTLYAKVINAWFLNQLPALAHQNRITFLKERLVSESARMLRHNRKAKIFNLGCGPAGEIQEFLAEQPVCENAQFTLLDFNEETIRYTTKRLHDISQQHGRKTPVEIQKRSVAQLIKDSLRSTATAADGKYDFVYCAGLFDYLPDKVCQQLTSLFYRWLAPGGLLLLTNVDGTRPFHNKLEFILDWNLIYRNGRQLMNLAPAEAPRDACTVLSDLTAVNVFLEVRKPLHE